MKKSMIDTVAQIIANSQNAGPFAHLGEITEKEDGDIEISVRVTDYENPEINTDTIGVTITLMDTGNEDEGGTKYYDPDVNIGNGDFASMSDMVAAFAAVDKKFKELGLNTRFGKLTGE